MKELVKKVLESGLVDKHVALTSTLTVFETFTPGRPMPPGIEVLVAPRYEPRLDEATNAAIADARRSAFESLSPGHVTQTTAWGAGHDIHIDRPDLVIASVRRLVSAAR